MTFRVLSITMHIWHKKVIITIASIRYPRPVTARINNLALSGTTIANTNSSSFTRSRRAFLLSFRGCSKRWALLSGIQTYTMKSNGTFSGSLKGKLFHISSYLTLIFELDRLLANSGGQKHTRN